MVFSSYSFILAFLPITLLGLALINRMRLYNLRVPFLVFASFVFYGYWNPSYLFLIGGSIIINYSLSFKILPPPNTASNSPAKKRKFFLISAIIFNLALLAYYKYANFFIDNLNSLAGLDYTIGNIILPIGISFFTFQQIAYQVDAYRDEVDEHNFMHYCLFVAFFPQLIAGPIVHHKDILPQLKQPDALKITSKTLMIGITIFIIGLAKKTILADPLANIANPIFEAAERGIQLSFFESWAGITAYTGQIYFDFSGYSDMAIGLAAMIGLSLPLNFNSPYKAKNIIEFWRRWHITLSQFLRDYLYIPLGGNRKGGRRRYINLLITMVLGGLWHGAAWVFVIWGALHGLYLIINHAWQIFSRHIGIHNSTSWWQHALSVMLTFIAVSIAWVFFRATSFDAATEVLKGMFGFNLHHSNALINTPFTTIITLLIMFIIIWRLPNTQEFIGRVKYLNWKKQLKSASPSWKPNIYWASVIAVLAVMGFMAIQRNNEFIYFQF